MTIWIGSFLVFMVLTFYYYPTDFRSPGGELSIKKIAAVFLAFAVLFFVSGLYVLRPVFVVNLKNKTDQPMQIETGTISDPINWVEASPLFRQRRSIEPGGDWVFNRYRACGGIFCRHTSYVFDIKASTANETTVYQVAIPETDSLFTSCGNFFYCDVDVEINSNRNVRSTFRHKGQ